jgi:hypothetical protein
MPCGFLISDCRVVVLAADFTTIALDFIRKGRIGTWQLLSFEPPAR